MPTWYPPGQDATVRAVRLAAEHRTPKKALAALEAIKAGLKEFPRALYDCERTAEILRFWERDGA